MKIICFNYRSEPYKKALDKSAQDNLAQTKSAPYNLAPYNLAPVKSDPDNLAPDKSTYVKSEPDKKALMRFILFFTALSTASFTLLASHSKITSSLHLFNICIFIIYSFVMTALNGRVIYRKETLLCQSQLS